LKRRVPVGSRKWKEITDFDLKVLSVVIIALSLISVSLLLYAVYLKFQKSQVDVVIKEPFPAQQPPIEEIVRTATETVYYTKSPSTGGVEETPTIYSSDDTLETGDSSVTIVPVEQGNQKLLRPLELGTTTEAERIANPKEQKEQANDLQTTEQTQPEGTNVEEEPKFAEENKYLKGLAKFDYNILLSRMAENLPSSKLYLYVVDSETALKLAKMTQNYIIDYVDGRYHLACTKNIAPDLNPSTGIYTVKTKPVKDPKEVFKSVVNLRTFGISAFSVTTSDGYILCMGVFRTEVQARRFYYSQDWSELSKYANVSEASVSRIGD